VITKAFILSIIVVPIMMVVGGLVPKLMKDRSAAIDKTIVVIDDTGQLMPALQREADDHNTNEIKDPKTLERISPKYILEAGPGKNISDTDRLALSDRIRKEEIFAFVELPADLLATPPGQFRELKFYSQKITSSGERRWFERALQRAIQSQRLRSAGIDPAVVEKSRLPLWMEGKALYKQDASGKIVEAAEGERELSFVLPIGVMMTMFLAVMMSQYMLQSTIEEKQQRIAEVLLGSINPTQLMMGKLLANIAVSLTMVSLYLLGGYVMAQRFQMTDLIPYRLIGWILLFQVFGVVMYGSIFGAVGAACSELRDAQGLMMPVMLLLIMPMFLWFAVMEDPNSNLALGLSLVPTMTPMFMPFRMALNPELPMWQPLLGLAIAALSAWLCIFAAGRVFRIGILMQGKPPKMIELLRWTVRG